MTELAPCDLLWDDVAVDAADGVVICLIIPIVLLRNGIPLFLRSTKVDDGQAVANFERTLANAGDAVRDGDTGQADATGERIPTNAGDALWDGDAGQAAAT